MSFIVRENDRYKDYDTEYPAKWFSVNMYAVNVDGTDDETKVPVVTRRKINLGKCVDLVTANTIRRANFTAKNEAFEKNSRCFVFSPVDEIQGAVGEKVFRYMEIRVEPCQDTDTTCQTKDLAALDYLRSPTPRALLLTAHERLSSISIDLGIVDTMMNLNNFTVPLNRTVMTDSSLRLALEEQFRKDILIS